MKISRMMYCIVNIFLVTACLYVCTFVCFWCAYVCTWHASLCLCCFVRERKLIRYFIKIHRDNTIRLQSTYIRYNENCFVCKHFLFSFFFFVINLRRWFDTASSFSALIQFKHTHTHTISLLSTLDMACL